jgi:hypothetical protein
MTNQCHDYRSQIARALLGELAPEDHAGLDAHLRECSPCAREREEYAETLRVLELAADARPPRHFFVYPEKRPLGAGISSAIPPRWALALAASLVLAVGAVALGLLGFEIRVENGSYALRLGSAPVPQKAPQTVDLEAFKNELMGAMLSRQRAENANLAKALRGEIDRSRRALSPTQRRALEGALAALEARLDNRILDTAVSLGDTTRAEISSLFGVLEEQRQRDLAAISDRIRSISYSTEQRGTQTDAILATLLEAAEFRLR